MGVGLPREQRFPDGFHEAALERAARFPRWLLASQTHDTKRAGDVRARIGALAGMHERWAERVRIWRDLTGGMDDPNEEYLVWQTLVGAWPIVPQRLERYLEKALREAKRNTSWVEPDERHEQRAKRFIRSLYENQEFLDDFEPFAQEVAVAGEHASLGALLLRLTAPGLPDLYQGDEFWSLKLVDPDNRRPIDRKRRHRAREQATPNRETMKFHLVRAGAPPSFGAPRCIRGLVRTPRARPQPGRLRSRRPGSRPSSHYGRRTRKGVRTISYRSLPRNFRYSAECSYCRP